MSIELSQPAHLHGSSENTTRPVARRYGTLVASNGRIPAEFFSSRLLHIDALKALAAQAIVLHHLAAYGPAAEAVQSLLPGLIAAL